MSQHGYIYLRYNELCELYKALKLGSTKEIINRGNTYHTYEIKAGKFIFVIELLNYDCDKVESLLKLNLDKYNIYFDAGTEFFDKCIIDKIIPILNENNIQYKQLSEDELNNLNAKQYNKVKKNHREDLQHLYLIDIIPELNKYKKCFIKAPTGFGKSVLYYKLLSQKQLYKILFLTPRKLLNEQIVEIKYSHYIDIESYTIIHFSNLSSTKKESLIKKYINKDKLIITSCYQSYDKLIELIGDFKFDVVIYDEAHFITGWKPDIINHDIAHYKIFGSATPTEYIENNPLIFGKVIEKVRVYELINLEILCNIQTIIKQLDNKKKEYHNLKDLIVESMTKYNKLKGIVYVNDTTNAEKLYNLMKKQNTINTYLYVSKNIEVESEDDIDIKKFEEDKNKSIIIVVGKLGYGYDNPFIDFICLGDQRQSDIDIRQIIGRGVRWNKKVYPNKLLHLLIPLYKDEFGNNEKNEHLKKYLDYIIGECGQDIIIKSDGSGQLNNKNNSIKEGIDYDGDLIPIEILNDYCTTGYNMFSKFINFLKANKIYDEHSYNKLKESQSWMPNLGNIHEKYKKFCFRDINPNNRDYYWDKQDAIKATDKCNKILVDKLGKDKYSELSLIKKINKINELDSKIPPCNLNLYYGN